MSSFHHLDNSDIQIRGINVIQGDIKFYLSCHNRRSLTVSELYYVLFLHSQVSLPLKNNVMNNTLIEIPVINDINVLHLLWDTSPFGKG